MKMITSMNNTVAFLKSLEKLNDQKKQQQYQLNTLTGAIEIV